MSNYYDSRPIAMSELKQLTTLCLACPHLDNPAGRLQVSAWLPFKDKIKRAAIHTAADEMEAILLACLNVQNGLQKLLEVLTPYDGGTIPFNRLSNFITQLGNVEAPDTASQVPNDFQPHFSGSNNKTVLFVAANPIDKISVNAEAEYRDVKQQLSQRASKQVITPMYEGAIHFSDFTQHLLRNKPYILHFSGHGEKTGELCFLNRDEKSFRPPVEAIGALFKEYRKLSKELECVLLNACYSETQAQAIAKHTPYVIGMNDVLGGVVARLFVLGFYQTLAEIDKCDIETAFNFARIQIMAHPDYSNKYTIPVLYKNGQQVGAD